MTSGKRNRKQDGNIRKSTMWKKLTIIKKIQIQKVKTGIFMRAKDRRGLIEQRRFVQSKEILYLRRNMRKQDQKERKG